MAHFVRLYSRQMKKKKKKFFQSIFRLLKAVPLRRYVSLLRISISMN